MAMPSGQLPPAARVVRLKHRDRQVSGSPESMSSTNQRQNYAHDYGRSPFQSPASRNARYERNSAGIGLVFFA